MQAIHYLVDCDGKTLASPFRSVRATLGDGLSEAALIGCAVNKLGYVHVQEWPRGFVVSYRRPVTTPVALAGAIYLLADLGDKRAIFSIADGGQRYLLCRNRAQAIGRLVSEMRRVEGFRSPRGGVTPEMHLPTELIRFMVNRKIL
jgi:hypothetical protein